MSEEVLYSVLTLQRAGYGAEQVNLNRPADYDEPHRAFLIVLPADDNIDVLVCRGMCPTGGHDIEVCEVSACDDPSEVCITAAFVDPAPGDVVTMMMTRPVKVVRFPRDAFLARQISVRDPAGCVMDRKEVDF